MGPLYIGKIKYIFSQNTSNFLYLNSIFFFTSSENKNWIKFSEFKYASCADAFWSGRLNPNPGQPIPIRLSGGSSVNCSIENLLNGKSDCPVGWFGSADDEFCFQVNSYLVDNEEAARYCVYLIYEFLYNKLANVWTSNNKYYSL